MKVVRSDIRTNKWGTVENNLDDVSYFQTLFITLEIGECLWNHKSKTLNQDIYLIHFEIKKNYRRNVGICLSNPSKKIY